MQVHVEMQSNGSKFDGRIMVLHMANGLLEFYEENPDNGIRIGDYLRCPGCVWMGVMGE